MPNNGALAEYLVKIGWSSDMTEMNKVQQVVTKTFNKFDEHIDVLKKSWVGSMATIVASFYSVTKHIVKFLDIQARIDLENRNMAKQYMVSADAMMAYNNALSELNISYEDLYYATDEVKKRFNDLVVLGRETEAPEGLEDTMVLVRDISFQFNRLHVILQNGKRYIAYYIGQFAGGDLADARDKLSAFIDKLKTDMPVIAKTVGSFMGFVIKLARGLLVIATPLIKSVFSIMRWLLELPARLNFDHFAKAFGGLVDAVSGLWDAIMSFKGDVTDNPIIKFLNGVLEIVASIVDGISFIIDGLSMIGSGLFGDPEETHYKYEGMQEKYQGTRNIGAGGGGFLVQSYTRDDWFDKLAAGDTITNNTTTDRSTKTQTNNINITNNVKSVGEATTLQQRAIDDTLNSTNYFKSPVN